MCLLPEKTREELATEISVFDYIDTIEYDYPAFHLSMRCYEGSIISGKLELLEHENACWLTSHSIASSNSRARAPCFTQPYINFSFSLESWVTRLLNTSKIRPASIFLLCFAISFSYKERSSFWICKTIPEFFSSAQLATHSGRPPAASSHSVWIIGYF